MKSKDQIQYERFLDCVSKALHEAEDSRPLVEFLKKHKARQARFTLQMFQIWKEDPERIPWAVQNKLLEFQKNGKV